MTIDRIVGSDKTSVTVVYKLDGSVSLNAELRSETVSRATWSGAKLTILTRLGSNIDDQTFPQNKLERTLWLDPDGRLFVETTNGLEPSYVTTYTRAFFRSLLV